MKITGQTLIDWGFKPGAWFKEAIEAADMLARENHFNGTNHTETDMVAVVKGFEPPPIVFQGPQDHTKVPTHFNIDAEQDFEIDNLNKVTNNILDIAKVPVVRAVSVMPDACPQGGGGIPVGAVAVTEGAIVPGWHSADICCSVALTAFPDDTDPIAILDAGMKISHFGKGGRPHSHDMQVSQDLLDEFENNPYLRNMGALATKQFGTQGDGNHFFYVGRIESTGHIALVTHHGSRGPGAKLYNKGIEIAQKMTGEIAPMFHKNNLWIPYDTQEGQDYWEALQIIRKWTKGNHFTIHNAIAKAIGAKDKDRYWNEHNFVFKREYQGKNYFSHAKGATPSYAGFSPDAYTGKTLIPLNMAAPILITEVNQNVEHGMDFVNNPSLGFCPHGAGRNFSRTDFGRRITRKAKEMIADVSSRFDVRAFSGKHDISEFPEAYKNADEIIRQINKFDLTKVVDKVQPIGCIMAGHDGIDYRAIKKAKKARRMAEEEANER
jgi:tRNA-splicing ligase RtcB